MKTPFTPAAVSENRENREKQEYGGLCRGPVPTDGRILGRIELEALAVRRPELVVGL